MLPPMCRALSWMLLVGVFALAAVPTPARGTRIGVADQKFSVFADKRYRWLGLRDTRLVVSWSVLRRHDWERPFVGRWLAGARRTGARPLITFGHEWTGPRRHHLPTLREYRGAFLAFHRRYPWITQYAAWNEANHCSQPTCHRPERAAAYFDVLRDACPRCTVVAADVLDQPGMGPWLARFTRAAHHVPRVWGLHNYLDANRLRSSGTRRLLAAVRGRVWITETGGVVRRLRYRGAAHFPESAEHAALATDWVLRLARSQPRVDRLYLYQWNADSLFSRWDSGLIDPFGRRRPAFDVLARALGRDPSRAPADPVFKDPHPQKPLPNEPAPPTPQATSQSPPARPAQPQPSCLLLILCPRGA